MQAMAAALLLGVVLLSGGPARAGDTPLRYLTPQDADAWGAVGRLDIGDAGFCTGTLIAPAIVLTAAHCLFDPATRNRIDATEIRFRIGKRDGSVGAEGEGLRAVLPDPYVYPGASGGDVARDVALIVLRAPIHTAARSHPAGVAPDRGARLSVVSYAHDRADWPALQETCAVLGRPDGVIVTSCDADFGSSGAPVFAHSASGPVLVSVVSAKARMDGRQVTLAAPLDRTLARLRAALIATTPAAGTWAASQARQPSPEFAVADLSSGDGGAKFIRP